MSAYGIAYGIMTLTNLSDHMSDMGSQPWSHVCIWDQIPINLYLNGLTVYWDWSPTLTPEYSSQRS